MQGKELFDIVNGILMYLFERENTQLRNRIMGVLPRHNALGGSSDGFRYLGRVFTNLVGESKKRGTYDPLNPALVPEMASILSEQETNQADRERIRQALALVLRDTQTPQDRRDALPNCLLDIAPGCQGLERTREEGYTLADNPRAYSQYMQLREKIEFYVAARLLY